MDKDLSYQKASRIRGTSFADLLSDQLSGDSTIRGALKKTISLKTKAGIKGLKEKFDPLNVAKFLTGGSSLGPALLGKITGRSEKDIQYFSGRMRPIREKGTASKIGREPGTGMSEGVNEMLRKIYYLMQITRESDLERREKEMNFQEEKSLEDEKRHKELLNVLSKLSGGVQTATEENNSGGLLKTLMDLFGRIPGIPVGLGGRTAGNLARTIFSGITRIAISFISSPAFIVAAAPTLLLAMVAKEKSEIEANPFDPKYDNNPYALSLRNKTAAGREAKKNTAKASKQMGTARRAEIEDAVKSDFNDEELKKEYGADRITLQNWLSDPKNLVWIKPVAMPQTKVTPPAETPRAPGATATPVTPEVKPTEVTPAAVDSTPESMTQSTSAPGSIPESMTQTTSIPAAPSAPEIVAGTGLTSRLNDAINVNREGNLPMRTPDTAPTVVNNVNTTQQRRPTQKVADLDTIAVRNLDDTFMRLIMDNTRVV